MGAIAPPRRTHKRPGLAIAALASVALALPACDAHLPKAPPPPTTSKGVATTTTAPPAKATGAVPTAPAKTPTTGTTAAPAANVPYDFDALATYAVGPQPSNWNIHSLAASAAYSTLAQVLAQLWPSAFEVGASGVPMLNTSLLQSATEVSDDPQEVVYQINPRAVWSDGVPITYRDFAYNWEAQSGRAGFSDVGGKAFTPLGTAGYHDIAAVEGSPADPYTVTVVFSSPYPDWRSLFQYLVPAHVAEPIGFDTGFTDPVSELVSGGPFLVSQLQEGYSLLLVRNARYWGNPANLSSVTYYFASGTAEVLNALSAGELDVAAVQAVPSEYQQLQAVGGLSVQAVASAEYEDLDFNEKTGPFTSAVLRQAVMMSVDRTSMASVVLSPYGLAAKPVENRVFLPGEPGYSPNGANFDQPGPSAALQVLASHGYSQSGGVLEAPDGAPVEVSLSVSADDPVAAQLANEVVASCAAIGIRVSVTAGDGTLGEGPASDEGAVPPPPGWQMAIELRQIPEFASAISASYEPGGAANLDGYSGAGMVSLLAQLPKASAAQLPVLYNQVDALAWSGFVDLPLVFVPVVIAVNRGLLNLEPGPYYANIAWDEQNWGFAAT